MANVYTKERTLEQEIAPTVEGRIPGVEVLAIELSGPERFTVYIDRQHGGVDHALCERVTDLLRGYLDRFTVDVSSPGFDRPLRKAEHFARYVGREVVLRTAEAISGRKRFRGEVVSTQPATVTLKAGGEAVEIPYEAIVRGNLIEGS